MGRGYPPTPRPLLILLALVPTMLDLVDSDPDSYVEYGANRPYPIDLTPWNSIPSKGFAQFSIKLHQSTNSP